VMIKPVFWEQEIELRAKPCMNCWVEYGFQSLAYVNPQGFTMCTHCDVPQPEALVPVGV
jgi:hypothetical protein